MAELITIDEAIASAASIIKDSTREDRQFFKFWIWRAFKQLGNPKFAQKIAELPVENLVARKPEDHLYTLDLSLIDSGGNDINYNYQGYRPRLHPITSINNPKFISIYEDQDCIHLDSVGSDICFINMRYWSVPVDENGDPYIPEYYTEALMMWVKYNYAMRESKSQAEIAQLKTEWKIQAAKVRGRNQMPDVVEGREILDNWMTLLPKNSSLKFDIY